MQSAGKRARSGVSDNRPVKLGKAKGEVEEPVDAIGISNAIKRVAQSNPVQHGGNSRKKTRTIEIDIDDLPNEEATALLQRLRNRVAPMNVENPKPSQQAVRKPLVVEGYDPAGGSFNQTGGYFTKSQASRAKKKMTLKRLSQVPTLHPQKRARKTGLTQDQWKAEFSKRIKDGTLSSGTRQSFNDWLGEAMEGEGYTVASDLLKGEKTVHYKDARGVSRKRKQPTFYVASVVKNLLSTNKNRMRYWPYFEAIVQNRKKKKGHKHIGRNDLERVMIAFSMSRKHKNKGSRVEKPEVKKKGRKGRKGRKTG